MDFVVDGGSLARQLVASQAGPDLMSAYVPVLVLDLPTGFPAEESRRLIGESPSRLPSGRVPLFVCAECGDLGCGAVTAVIQHRSDTVVWRDLAYENDFEPFDPDGIFAVVGPIEFDRSEYLEVFAVAPAWRPGGSEP